MSFYFSQSPLKYFTVGYAYNYIYPLNKIKLKLYKKEYKSYTLFLIKRKIYVHRKVSNILK